MTSAIQQFGQLDSLFLFKHLRNGWVKSDRVNTALGLQPILLDFS